MNFSKLFEPVNIGRTQLKNRIAMAPINLFPPSPLCDEDGELTQGGVEFYAERAKGGVGAIITGVFKVEKEIDKCSKNGVMTWPIFSSRNLGRWAELVDNAHAYGCKLFIQLSAGAGRVVSGDVIESGVTPVSASEGPAFWARESMTRSLRKDEVSRIIAAFGEAANLVSVLGIDGVELHGHEGYLMDQFMTTLWNSRGDEYGGDIENRMRFPLEIIGAIRERAGSALPIIFRYGVKHFVKGPWATSLHPDKFEEKGRDLSESIEIAKLLEKHGVAALDLDVGSYEGWYWAHPPIYQPHGYAIELISTVRKSVGIPVITAGRLDVPELAEKVLEDGRADIISLGRALLADPFWPEKVRRGEKAEIRPCIGCNDGCEQRPLFHGRVLSCTVNPACGRETLIPRPVLRPRSVMVIGGGVAGMEVARTSRERGHRVTIYEKSDRLGGHLLEAEVPDFKKDIRALLGWYVNQVKRLEIPVVLNREVTPEFVHQSSPEVVVVATGSSASLPGVSGLQGNPIAMTSEDILLSRREAGRRVIVLGGGAEGCETALWLAEQGKKVTIVEQLEVMSSGIFQANKDMLLDMLNERGVEVLTHAQAEVSGRTVSITTREGKRIAVEVDSIVIATGMKANISLYRSLLGKIQAEVYSIGDCNDPRKIYDAILEGYLLGNGI